MGRSVAEVDAANPSRKRDLLAMSLSGRRDEYTNGVGTRLHPHLRIGAQNAGLLAIDDHRELALSCALGAETRLAGHRWLRRLQDHVDLRAFAHLDGRLAREIARVDQYQARAAGLQLDRTRRLASLLAVDTHHGPVGLASNGQSDGGRPARRLVRGGRRG